MTAIEKIRAKFWDQMPSRSGRIGALLEEVGRNEPESEDRLASEIHTAKGEAQLLALETCAGLLEGADRLVKATKGRVRAQSLDALRGLPQALLELAGAPQGGAKARATLAAIERALGESGTERA